MTKGVVIILTAVASTIMIFSYPDEIAALQNCDNTPIDYSDVIPAAGGLLVLPNEGMKTESKNDTYEFFEECK